MAETEDYDKSAIPTAHKTSHQDGGTDEISVEGLAGDLADPQESTWARVSGKPTTFAPEAHKTSHQDAGSDEVSVLGLSGLLADPQTPLAHKTSHQDGGSDEISVASLSGQLADAQPSTWTLVSGKPTTFTPEAHKTSHQDGGADEISAAGLSGLLADDQHALDSEVINLVYPVGSIYVSTISTNPGTLFGTGTWAAFGAGRVLVGLDAGQTEFDTVEETGGEKTHALNEAELAPHSHPVSNYGDIDSGPGAKIPLQKQAGTTATGFQTDSKGSGTAHNNLQPYIVVYMWKRTA